VGLPGKAALCMLGKRTFTHCSYFSAFNFFANLSRSTPPRSNVGDDTASPPWPPPADKGALLLRMRLPWLTGYLNNPGSSQPASTWPLSSLTFRRSVNPCSQFIASSPSSHFLQISYQSAALHSSARPSIPLGSSLALRALLSAPSIHEDQLRFHLTFIVQYLSEFKIICRSYRGGKND
jgi:hypothetical protein